MRRDSMHPQLGNPKLDLEHADQIREGTWLIESSLNQVSGSLIVPPRDILRVS